MANYVRMSDDLVGILGEDGITVTPYAIRDTAGQGGWVPAGSSLEKWRIFSYDPKLGTVGLGESVSINFSEGKTLAPDGKNYIMTRTAPNNQGTYTMLVDPNGFTLGLVSYPSGSTTPTSWVSGDVPSIYPSVLDKQKLLSDFIPPVLPDSSPLNNYNAISPYVTTKTTSAPSSDWFDGINPKRGQFDAEKYGQFDRGANSSDVATTRKGRFGFGGGSEIFDDLKSRFSGFRGENLNDMVSQALDPANKSKIMEFVNSSGGFFKDHSGDISSALDDVYSHSSEIQNGISSLQGKFATDIPNFVGGWEKGDVPNLMTNFAKGELPPIGSTKWKAVNGSEFGQFKQHQRKSRKIVKNHRTRKNISG